jgi:hypothetical protein
MIAIHYCIYSGQAISYKESTVVKQVTSKVESVQSKVITFDPLASAIKLESIMQESNLYGIDRSFVSKVIFGQVEESCILTFESGKQVTHSGLFVKGQDSPSKVIDGLKKSGNLDYYQLIGYWSARVLHNRQVLSYTNVLLCTLLKSLFESGLKKWTTMDVLESDKESTRFTIADLDKRIAYLADVADVIKKHFADNKPHVTRSVKSTPVFSGETIDL